VWQQDGHSCPSYFFVDWRSMLRHYKEARFRLMRPFVQSAASFLTP